MHWVGLASAVKEISNMDMGDLPLELQSPLSVAVAARDRDTVAMVRDAVARKSVRLAFQPVIQAARPDKVAFYEGLIRILDPQGREIVANDFIGAVETSEVGRIIDCLALEYGVAALQRDATLRLSINMSARSIGYPRWMETLDRALEDDATVAERLILEITESSAIVVPEIVQVFMARLQDRGISFALDDFGAGYTAFRYFKQFCFDILKIDGAFIRGIAQDSDNQVMVQAMMAVGQHFEMFTVAESVETADDAQWLAHSGIDCMQGYYFGAPSLDARATSGALQAASA